MQEQRNHCRYFTWVFFHWSTLATSSKALPSDQAVAQQKAEWRSKGGGPEVQSTAGKPHRHFFCCSSPSYQQQPRPCRKNTWHTSLKNPTWILWYFKMLSGVYITGLSTPGSTLHRVWNKKCLVGVISIPCHTTQMRCAISVWGLKPHPDIKELWCSIRDLLSAGSFLSMPESKRAEEKKAL